MLTLRKNTMLIIEYSNDQTSYPFTATKNSSQYGHSICLVTTNTIPNVIEAYYDRIATVDPQNPIYVVLPHLQLLRNIGNHIKHISLNPGPDYMKSRFRDDGRRESPSAEYFEDESRSNIFSALFGYSTILESLTVTTNCMAQLDLRVQNDSITRLEIKKATIFS